MCIYVKVYIMYKRTYYIMPCSSRSHTLQVTFLNYFYPP